MTIILFLLVLLVTVLVHEWGHFYAARKCGMIVEEFGFGKTLMEKSSLTLWSENGL